MSSILKGLQLNEVDPRNFDSDIDYYNALNRKPRGRSEDDYVEPQDDEPIKFKQDPNARPQYSISKDEDRQAGYNMTLTVKAPTTQKAQWAAESFVDSEWGAKKQIGKITPVSDGVVQVHMIDNHKYGMWKPWKDEEPTQKPISFGEAKEEDYGPEYQEKVKRVGQRAKELAGGSKTVWDEQTRRYKVVPSNSSVQAKTDDNLRAYYAQRKAEKQGVAEGWKEEAQELEDWSKEVNMRLYRAHESQRLGLARQLSKLEQKHFGSEFTHPNLTNVVWSALRALQKGEMVHYDPQRVGQMPFGNIVGDDAKIIAQYNITRDELAGYRMLHDKNMVDNLEQFLKLRRLVRAKSWPLEYFEELEKLTPEEAWLKMANDLNWSKDNMSEGMSEEKQRLDPKCWKGYKKQGTKMKGDTRVNNCVPVKESRSAILEGLQQVDEINWKHAAAAGALALGALGGAGHAQAADLSNYNTQYLQQVASGEHPRPMVSVEDAKAELQARANSKQQATAPARIDSPSGPSGFSKEYLQRAADPNRFGRYMISVEKAQELLQQMQGK